VLSLFAIPLLFCAALSAQEIRGTLLGRISDPSGAPVPGAAITVTNVDTNISIKTNATHTGDYQAPFLSPGNYMVTVEHAGFRKLERKGIRISEAEKVTLDLALELGATSESVTVTASAPLLEAANADLGTVIEKNYVMSISPSLSRNVLNLMYMTPGVQGSTAGVLGDGTGTFQIQGSGGKQGSNEFMIDGIPNTSPDGPSNGKGLAVFIPSLDSVEEMKVHTTLFDAAYGHSNGGAISMTTKSGTNTLHGALYEFKQWKALNANSWNNNRLGVGKPPVSFYQWGYAVGGPIYLPQVYDGRNRTLFFTSLERDNSKSNFIEQSHMPTAQERTGDFSQTINLAGTAPLAIYDPFSTVVDSSGKATRQPFAGAKIPASRLDAVGKAVMGLYPLPNMAGPTTLAGFSSQLGLYNWTAAGLYWRPEQNFDARVDHIINSRQRIYVRASRLTLDFGGPDCCSTVFFPGAYQFPNLSYNNLGIDSKDHPSFAFDDIITLSPTFVGSVRLGYQRHIENFTPTPHEPNAAKLLNLPSVIANNQALASWPIITFASSENLTAIGTSTDLTASDTYALLTDFTKIKGRYSLKFGADIRVLRRNSVSQGSSAPGTFNYDAGFTQSDPYTSSMSATSGSSMASLLLGVPSGGSLGYSSPASYGNHYYAFFVQDDWKVSKKLTLNIGLRYELETPYTERYNRAESGLDFGATLPVSVPGYNLKGGLLFAGVNGNPRTIAHYDTNNFGPRFGLAYQIGAKTVLRGGYGLFYSAISYNTTSRGSVGTFNAVTNYVSSQDGGATPYTTIENPFPNGLVQPIGSSIGLMAQVGNSLSFLNPNVVSPYNQQWQMSIQRELPFRMLVEVIYSGMLSVKELENFDLNELPDVYLAQGSAQNNSVPNPFYGVFPASSSLGSRNVPIRRLWVVYPQFTSLTINGANTGRATYNAGILKVEKRFSRGLNFLFDYTKSRQMTSNITSLVNVRHYRAVGPYDQPNIFRFAAVWQLPTLQGQNRVLRQAAGGWSTAGYFNYATGTPLSVSQANGRPYRIAKVAYSGSVENRLGDKRGANGMPLNPYFNINAFLPLPTQYMVTPEPPLLDELRSPGRPVFNISFFKRFPIHERVGIQLRLETSNFFNTPSFGSPGTNMSSPSTFGVISSGGSARSMQAGARLEF
jgi:hypothetical protein